MRRRRFLTNLALLPAASFLPVKTMAADESYPYFGRTPIYRDFRVIDPGRKISRIESFTGEQMSIVRVETDDGAEGLGQMSTYDVDISATVLHRRIAPLFLGKDPVDIDILVDQAVEASYKYPWSYSCRALAGVDTAIWDLYGKIRKKPVVQLLGSDAKRHGAYGSSMSREISPEDEGKRLRQLREERGYRAFKVRVGQVNGHNRDAWPGRTERLIPTVRKAVGENVDLLVDGNSCYTPDKAIEIGRILEDNNYHQFEEPCPYWELEWTAEVTRALKIPVSGGEQDNDLAQWRRMIRMHAVDVVQPDICYIGGITRTFRVAKLAERAGLKFVPHSANHSLVTLMSAHMMGAMPNAGPYLEYSIEFDTGVNQEARAAFSPQLEIKDGLVLIPQEPGWGVQIHKEWLQKAKHQVSHAT